LSLINKYLVIFNPIAGKGAAVRDLPRIKTFFEERKLPLELVQTERVGHASEIARNNAGQKGVAVIAAGGDGTCNEVINGLLSGKKKKDPPRLFGVLPLGRGNDFSFGGRVPARLDEALEVLAVGKTSPLDAGIIKGGFYPEGRYFGNGVGVGFDTIVGLRAAKMKHVHDALAYVFGALHTLITFPAPPLVEIGMNGGRRVVKALQISLMNGNRMGGLFYMAPEAVNNDGLLDMCLVEKIPRWRMLNTVVHYTKGTQGRCKGVTMDRAPSFTLKALKGGMVVHADGETICTAGKELVIECVPGALEIIHR
jgi:YegS/Rv2252/BmrU family lipid kinase